MDGGLWRSSWLTLLTKNAAFIFEFKYHKKTMTDPHILYSIYV